MKLRPRIALVSCLVALTSVGVTGALLIRQSRAYSSEELLQRQLLLAQTRAFAVGDELETASRELVRLSQMAEVDLTAHDRNSLFFNIGLQIVDGGGRCLWSEPASDACPGRLYAREPWFIEGRRAGGALVMREQAPGEDSVINLVVPIGGS